jgi:hypothetical protein
MNIAILHFYKDSNAHSSKPQMKRIAAVQQQQQQQQ